MNNLVKSNKALNPWRDFWALDNIFDQAFNGGRNNFPSVNVSEDSNNYSVEIVAPGFNKEDFKLKVDGDILTVSAEKKSEKAEDGKGKEYTRREYNYSSFTRSFNLPDNVKDDAISAAYKDGVLELQLPKSTNQEKATKEITIN